LLLSAALSGFDSRLLTADGHPLGAAKPADTANHMPEPPKPPNLPPKTRPEPPVSDQQKDPGVVRAWLTTAGLTLCVDRRFTDWLGRGQADCTGRAFAALSGDPKRVEE
jgi:hypothetical protein